jgi:hypothetical protein
LPVSPAMEIIEALAESVHHVGGLSIDVVARRGSWKGLPLISIDTEELSPTPGSILEWFAIQETAYSKLVLSGLLNEYDLVHSLASCVVPLMLMAQANIPIVQTILEPPSHPSVKFPPIVMPSKLYVQVSGNRFWANYCKAKYIPPSIDLSVFKPTSQPTHEFLLYSGSGEQEMRDIAQEVAQRLNLLLYEDKEGHSVEKIKNAKALLYLQRDPSPYGAILPIRALACGTPVIGWQGSGLEEVLMHFDKDCLVPLGDVDTLVSVIDTLGDRVRLGHMRRHLILANHNRRGMTARYRELYREVTEANR